MAYNLKKYRKTVVGQLGDVGIKPTPSIGAVDKDSLDWQMAVKKVLALNPEFNDIDEFKKYKDLDDNQIMDMGRNVSSDTLEEAADSINETENTIKNVLSAHTGENRMKKVKPFNLKHKKAQIESNEFVEDAMGQQPLENSANGVSEEGRKFSSHGELKDWLLQYAVSENPLNEVWTTISLENPISPDNLKEAIESFFMDLEHKSPEEVLDNAKTIYDFIYGDTQEGVTVEAPYTQASIKSITKDIQKMAKDFIKKQEPKKSFNLKKTAQHKTLDNVIMWNSNNTRKVDPFSRQPISDWHIVERNKGFGLVVDDVWNIDWETLWRENVMDKYSRPYRDKDGNWVGGYINKRFEVDSYIPETNNYQLKPGQKRRAILPEYGNLESRLQTARSKGEIEGASNKDKPFNWKEAKSRKNNKIAFNSNDNLWIVDRYGYTVEETDGVSHDTEEDDFMYPHEYVLGKHGGQYFFANGYDVREIKDPEKHDCEIAMSNGIGRCQCGKHEENFASIQKELKEAKKKRLLNKFADLDELPEFKGIKPYRLPDDLEPVKAEAHCKNCGSQVSPTTTVCPNCGKSEIEVGQPCERKPDDKGKQYNPYSNKNPIFVEKGISLNRASEKNQKVVIAKKKKNKDEEDLATDNKNRVKETYESEEISQCVNPFDNINKKDDIKRRERLMEVTKSCEDLAIDG